MNVIFLFSSFFITGVALFALRPIAIRVGLVDIPGGRKTHINTTPLVGGLGIFFGMLCMSTIAPGVITEFAPLLSLSALVLFIGTIDDAKELTVAARMTGHTLVAIVMAVVAGIQLNSVGDIFYFGEIQLGALTIPVTVFATVGVINAINMADGIDGLSGGLVVIALGFTAFACSANGDVGSASFIVIMICSVMAFLTLNFRRPWHRRALVYLGDAGSTMLGFMLAWLLISSSQGEQASFAPVYALWFLAVPLFDTVNLLIKRPLRGLSPFKPGIDHLHHNLMSRGYKVEHVVLILTSVALLFGCIGLAGLYLQASETLMFELFIGLFIVYFLLSDRIKPKRTAETPA